MIKKISHFHQIIAALKKKSQNFSKWFSSFARVTIITILAICMLSGCRSEKKENIEESQNIKRDHNGPTTGNLNGYDWVDLGLPSGLKWATHNVGASAPEDFGYYIAWGEIEPKDYYSTINSITYKVSSKKLIHEGIIDETGTLTKNHDVAHVIWGEGWRIPTIEEWSELIDGCNWNFAAFNGVNGYLVTGPNKNMIFLPAAAFMQNKTIDNVGDFGDYWSSSVVDELTGNAYSLGYSSKSYGRRRYARYAGRTIRPVTD